MKKRADPKAGGNWTHRSTPGKHTANPGYKPGSWWVECSRCGLDYRAEDIKPEWTGAIVCKSCWEPRHPQDFVRPRRDRINVPGPVRGDSYANAEFNTAADGSTEPPPSTFQADTPGWTAIPDQTDEALSAITTFSLSTYDDESFVDTYGITQTISSYSIPPGTLPTGLSLDTSTGDITGTPTETADTEFPITVTATYTDGTTASTTFTWDIEYGGSAPDGATITGNDKGFWWDFSADEYMYEDSDLTRTTTITNGGSLYTVIDRFSTASEAREGHADAGHADKPTWTDGVRNGLGAATFSDEWASVGHIANDGVFTTGHGQAAYMPCDIFVVLQVPTIAVEKGHGVYSGQAASSHWLFQYANDEPQDGAWTIHTGWNDEVFPDFTDQEVFAGMPLSATEAGNWVIFYNRWGPDLECAMKVNGASVAALTAEVETHDANSDEANSSTFPGFKVGAMHNTTGASADIWPFDGYIGEVIFFGNLSTAAHKTSAEGLSAAEVVAIETYLAGKWGITIEGDS